MEAISLLDTEEIFLFVGSIFSILFTCSFIYNIYRLFKGTLNFIDIPIISISLCYINNFIFYTYSKYILHDLMKQCYLISIFISLLVILCYLIYEFNRDKIDTFMNVLLLISVTLSINKFLNEAINNEDKVKLTCGFSTFALLCGIATWIYKDIHIKSKNSLFLFTGIALILMSGCYFIFGIYFSEKTFIFPNLFGIIIGIVYVGFNSYYKNLYYTVQENKGNTVIDIDIKNEDEEDERENQSNNNIEENHLKKKRIKNIKH